MDIFLICSLFFITAIIYSSAGFGGGSSYLAILTLFNVHFMTLRSAALICNLVVVIGSVWLFYRNDKLDIKRILPFIILSIPAAFLGGVMRIEERTFFILLGVTLVLSAVAMWFYSSSIDPAIRLNKKHKFAEMAAGGGIGWFAGMVGIGGGIFLSPVLYLLRWAKPYHIAATTSSFILVNSVAGLTGQYFNPDFTVDWKLILPLALSVLIGGQLGARIMLYLANPAMLKKITAFLVLFVGIRLLWQYLLFH